MFKPQKPTGPAQPSRHKLPLVERPPKQEDISTLFTNALRIRGTLFELPIKPAPMSPVYSITCIFDVACNETIWAMYDGSETPKQLFSLPQSDLDMVFDMVCMACGATGASSIPAELSPGVAYSTAQGQHPAAQGQYPNQQGQHPNQQGQHPNQQGQHPNQQGQHPNQQGQYPNQQGQYSNQQGQYPNQQGQYPNQQGQYPNQQGQPPSQQGRGQNQPGPGQGQYSQQSSSQGQYPYQQEPGPYSQQAPTQGQYHYQSPGPGQHQYQQQSPASQPYSNQAPTPYEQQQQSTPYSAQQTPYGQQQAAYSPPLQNQYGTGQPAQFTGNYQQSQASGTPVSGSASTTPARGPEIPLPEFSNFIDLLSKGAPNLLLGHLFVESGILPEKCLDAALKLQELVRKGRLTNQQAVLAMKRAAELGGHLDDDIIEWAKDPELAYRRAEQPASGNTTKPNAGNANPSSKQRDNVASQRIVDLLKQAGLVSEEDLETARKVKAKHGGDICQILVSAAKLSNKTVEAAAEVQNFVAVGRLRIDKAIMALHYCERMRVGLNEALSELNIEIE